MILYCTVSACTVQVHPWKCAVYIIYNIILFLVQFAALFVAIYNALLYQLQSYVFCVEIAVLSVSVYSCIVCFIFVYNIILFLVQFAALFTAM